MNAAVSRAEVLGYEVDRAGLEETVQRCRALIAAGEPSHQVSLNAAKLVRARSDERLAEILHSADLLNADGESIVWASKLLGDPLPERVAGIDLMYRLLAEAEQRGYSVYVLGAKDEVLQEAIKRLRDLHPGLRFAGWRDGYFPVAEEAAVAQSIR